MGSFIEANYLYHMASKGGNILEVGTGPGKSALLMAQALKDFGVDGKVYTIGWESDQQDYANVWKRLRRYPELIDSIHHESRKSEEVHQNYPDLAFPFVYIDGDHSYEGVVKDIINYKSKVAPGGVIAFHDTNKEEVARAISEYLGWELCAEVHRIKGYRCGS